LQGVHLEVFGKELAALMAMKAMTDPGEDIEIQVIKTLSKKIRVAERSRPHVIQLWTAFQRTVQWRRSKGEQKPLPMVMALVIKSYNMQMPAKQRVTSDERDGLLNLIAQTPNFCAMLAKHWQSFAVPYSAVPVSLLVVSAPSRMGGSVLTPFT
jgi:hypothetical protein